jgi:DNA-binding GntR family transcriptional regulator
MATHRPPDIPPDNISLTDRAYYAVWDRLLRGELRLGMPVSSRRFAEELGMSHLPVSQALRRLENDGFLESGPRAGTRVRVPTEADIRERYEVREALESQAARLFAARATAVQKRELRRMAKQLDVLFDRSAAGGRDAAFSYAVHSYHFDLHMKIAQYAACEALRELIERNRILTFNWVYDVAANRRILPTAFHRDLVAVLAGGDEAAADQAMRAHIRYGVEERVRNIRSGIPSKWRGRRSHADR